MTETDWYTATNLLEMLNLLENRGNFSERKTRLFMVAVCRRIWDLLLDERSQKALEVAERFVDGLASLPELKVAHAEAASRCLELPAWTWVSEAANVAEWATSPTPSWDAFACALDAKQARSTAWDREWNSEAWTDEEQAQCGLVREIFSNPFRPVTLGPVHHTPTGVSLARAAYDERQLPSGELDSHRLAVLADALEEAGADAELIKHLRSLSPHVRGCWAVDLCLGLS